MKIPVGQVFIESVNNVGFLPWTVTFAVFLSVVWGPSKLKLLSILHWCDNRDQNLVSHLVGRLLCSEKFSRLIFTKNVPLVCSWRMQTFAIWQNHQTCWCWLLHPVSLVPSMQLSYFSLAMHVASATMIVSCCIVHSTVCRAPHVSPKSVNTLRSGGGPYTTIGVWACDIDHWMNEADLPTPNHY